MASEKDKLIEEQAAELEALKKTLADKEAQEAEKASKDAEKDAQLQQQAAELEALKKTLAAKESETEDTASSELVAETPKKKPVKIQLYKDENIYEDVQVFVNGRQYIIQRGVTVEVPAEVAEVLQHQMNMRNHIAAYNQKHAQKG